MRVDDEYEVANPPVILGRGGNGVVVEVTKADTGERFALKTISLSGLRPEEVADLRQELEIARSLVHPNIARVFESFERDEKLHIVMELCTGGSLCKWLNLHHSGFSEQVAATLVEKMLSAVNYCHAHSVVHRDIKLDNFVYEDEREDAELKLIDFGFAQQVQPGRREDMSVRLGTLSYMAPELVGPRTIYDSSVDMWALGVVTYALLCGRKPFRHEDRDMRKQMILRDDPQLDVRRWENVSENAKDFVRQLLHKQPRHRLNCHAASRHPWVCHMSALRRESSASTRPRSSRCDSCASSAPTLSLCLMSSLSTNSTCASASPADSVRTSTTCPSPRARGQRVCPSISSEIISSMQHFSQASEFKRAALEVIAFTTPPARLDELRRLFVQMDADNSGTLSLEEFQQELSQLPELGSEEVERIFRAVDLSKAGVVDVGEFCAAALLSQKNALSYPSLLSAFSLLDKDHDGYLDQKDLARALDWLSEASLTEAGVDKLLSSSGVGAREGKITFEDFKFLVRTSGAPINSSVRRHWAQRYETVCQNVSPICARSVNISPKCGRSAMVCQNPSPLCSRRPPRSRGVAI